MADQQSPFSLLKKKNNNQVMQKKPDKGRPWLKSVLFTLTVLFTIFLLGTMATVGAAAGYVASLVKDEPVREKATLESKISQWSQTSYAYFRDGSPIGRMRTDADRKVVTVKDVSPHVIDALLSTEDREFYTHEGIVPRSIMRAVYQKVTGADAQTGGSTITQQLVKNSILDDRGKTFERKAKEIFLAVRMDNFFSKDKILGAYLNSVYFGPGVTGRNMLGVQAAAQGMFGKDAKDLNLAQSAYIAGMVQRPNAYNPFRGEKYLKNGKRRMKAVLRNMVENKKITEAEYKEAAQFDIKKSLAKKGEKNAYSKYPYITMAVEEEAASILLKADGNDPKKLSKQGKYGSTLQKYRGEVLTGGYRIYTTIDQKVYKAMNKAAQNNDLYASPITYTMNGRTYKNAKEQVGAALLDTKTGATLGFVGGRNFKDSQVNRALGNDAPQQPGSAIKPLLDFGPALDRGIISPESIMIDEPLAHASGVYRNYTRRYDGAMTAREALMKSINIPAIKALRAVGVQAGLDYLRKMNFPVHEHDGEASAIGGFTYGFTPQRMAAGYAMLGNQGKFNEPFMIQRIEDANGKVVYEHKQDPVQVFSSRAAYWTTDMLRDVVRKGTGNYIGARAPGYDLAGKTGTTNNTSDVWFMGYTPDITLGVWIGYDQNKSLPNDKRAKIVWSAIFNAITKKDSKLSPPGHRFKYQSPLPYKCFECNKVKKKEENDGDGNGEKGPQKPPDRQTPPPSNDNPETGNPGGGQQGNGDSPPPPDDPENPGDDQQGDEVGIPQPPPPSEQGD
ncbi:transglycosylase domain-containing protein [Salinithrix halophila]|uniref:Transglycosylase domain-containing protein n=1 Tax=Salinithrix halophila TaxID=1485204 RepID=A0ABV8JCY3_9BACL